MRIAILQVMQQTVGKVIWLGLNLGKKCRKKIKKKNTVKQLLNFGCMEEVGIKMIGR